MGKKGSRSLWLYILHRCQWFYIWLQCYTECTVFLCGWWQWWGSRVEMGFSCACFKPDLGSAMSEKLYWGTRGQSVYLPHGRISTIPPSWAVFLLTCHKNEHSSVRRCSAVSISPPFWWQRLCSLAMLALVQTDTSQQLRDGLPWDFVQTLMISKWVFLMAWMICCLFLLCHTETNVVVWSEMFWWIKIWYGNVSFCVEMFPSGWIVIIFVIPWLLIKLISHFSDLLSIICKINDIPTELNHSCV